MPYDYLDKVRQCAVVPSGEKIFGQQSGEGISEQIKAWEKEEEENRKYWEENREQLEAEQVAWELRRKKELQDVQDKNDARKKMLDGLHDYLMSTSYIRNHPQDTHKLPYELDATYADRSNFIREKHEEWETKVWFEKG